MQQRGQQTQPVSPRKRPKTMKNDTRSAFLAPFRADRATAESDIIVHMAGDDLRPFAAAAAQRMSAYSVSAFLAETLFLVKTPPTTTKLGSGLPSSHGGHLRRSRDFIARAPQTGMGAA